MGRHGVPRSEPVLLYDRVQDGYVLCDHPLDLLRMAIHRVSDCVPDDESELAADETDEAFIEGVARRASDADVKLRVGLRARSGIVHRLDQRFQHVDIMVGAPDGCQLGRCALDAKSELVDVLKLLLPARIVLNAENAASTADEHA